MYASNTGTTSVCLTCNDTLLTEERTQHRCGPDPALLNAIDTTIYCINCAEVNASDNELCPACRTLEVWQVEEWLKESLWDNTGMVTIGSLTYEPVRVLKSVDPIAYNEMYLDYCDSLARDGYIIKNYNDN